MASDGMETSSAGQDPVRFYCPHPGCKRSFAELWRLKVHYRAPPDIRGSGKERGHGTELTHCPKCNKTLKQGKHHVGCAAGKTAGKATKKSKTPTTDDAALARTALASSPKLPALSPAHSPAAQPAFAQQLKREDSGSQTSDVLLPPLKVEGHGKGMLTNGFMRQPSAPSPPLPFDSLDIRLVQNAMMPASGAQHAQSALSDVTVKLPGNAVAQVQQSVSELPAFMRPAVGTPDQTGQVPAFMQQLQHPQQPPVSAPAFMQQQPASLAPHMQPQQQPLMQQHVQPQPQANGGMPVYMQQPSTSHTLSHQQPGMLHPVSSPSSMQPFLSLQQQQQQQLQLQQTYMSQQGPAMPSTSQPSSFAYQQPPQQQHQQQQPAIANLGLASVFDDVDHMIMQDGPPPSPPPLPPDFPVGLSHSLFNFSQFDASHRMPHQPGQLMPMPSVLAPSLAPANGLWAPDTTFEHSSDGDLMQFLFGAPDQPPTMATIHLHHFITDDADEGDAAVPKPPSPPSPPPMLQQPPARAATAAAAGPTSAFAGVAVAGGAGGADAGNGMLPPAAPPGSVHSSGMSTGTPMGMVSFGTGPGAANLAAAAAMGPPMDVDDCELGTEDADWPDLGFVDGMLTMPGTPGLPDGLGEGNGAVAGEQQPVASPSGGLDTVTAQMGHIKVENGPFSSSTSGHLPAAGMQQQGLRHCGDRVEAVKSGMDTDPLHGLLYSTCE